MTLTDITLRPAPADSSPEPPSPVGTPPAASHDNTPRVPLRPAVAAGLAGVAAATMVGGIFGSMLARLIAVAGVLLGTALGMVAARSRRPLIVQLLVPLVAVGAGIASTVGTGAEANLTSVILKAVRAGRSLRPPVPFDPGWRPLLIIGFTLLAFAAAWLGTAGNKPRLALLLPLPLLVFTGLSQPAEGEFLGAALSLPPLLLALAVSFSTGSDPGAERAGFELRRAVRVSIGMVLAVAALFGANNLGFLFPAPAVNLVSKPQLPKAVPLSAAKDRVLFEVRPDKGFTGPWRLGVLDVYDGNAWRISPIDPNAQVSLPPGGIIHPNRKPQVHVGFTIRDLGDSSTLPTPAGTAVVTTDRDLLYDPRSELLRQTEGRAPDGLSYDVRLPKYPDDRTLQAVKVVDPKLQEYLEVPAAPAAVAKLLQEVNGTPWVRFEHLQKVFMRTVVSAGQGTPIPVPPSRVQEILIGKHDATPYEIVSANAMLARWAGVPARIGFGFDGTNDEHGILTVRPKNAAQWLEVNLTGIWEPIIGPPPQSKSTLGSDPTRQDTTTPPSQDLAVDVYIAIQIDSSRSFETLARAIALIVLPIVTVLVGFWLGLPVVLKARRRRRRKAWAALHGPAGSVAVAYANLRDAATDLGVGDSRATPLEFLDLVEADDEHAELAWLVNRGLYGDLADRVEHTHARDAQRLAASVGKRLRAAQPGQIRVASVFSRLSLRSPFAPDLPGWRRPHTPRTAPSRRRLRRLTLRSTP